MLCSCIIYLNTSELLTVRQICQLQTAVFMHNYLNSLAPPVLTLIVLFQLLSHYHAYPALSSTHFSLISDICHIQRGAFSIKYVGAKLWNSIQFQFCHFNTIIMLTAIRNNK